MITKKSIRNPERYLSRVGKGSRFFIGAILDEEKMELVKSYGFSPEEGISETKVPLPIKTATTKNAEGYYIVHKDKKKEPRVIFRDYHIVDWHGNDHYGTCSDMRMCYPRTFMKPRLIALCLTGDKLLSAPLFNTSESLCDILLIMNMFLEIIGSFEVWDSDMAPQNYEVPVQKVPWEILPPGTREQKVKDYLQRVCRKKTNLQQRMIMQRHEHIISFNPENIAIGEQAYFGYIVYSFPEDLHVFECKEIDNATYVFKGEWEQVSKLTKMDIIKDKLAEARIYHTGNWKNKIAKTIQQGGE